MLVEVAFLPILPLLSALTSVAQFGSLFVFSVTETTCCTPLHVCLSCASEGYQALTAVMEVPPLCI